MIMIVDSKEFEETDEQFDIRHKIISEILTKELAGKIIQNVVKDEYSKTTFYFEDGRLEICGGYGCSIDVKIFDKNNLTTRLEV